MRNFIKLHKKIMKYGIFSVNDIQCLYIIMKCVGNILLLHNKSNEELIMVKLKKVSNILLLSFFVLISSTLSSCSEKPGAKSEDYLNFKTGNQWTYIIETKAKDSEGKEKNDDKSHPPAESGKSEKAEEGKVEKSEDKKSDSKSEITLKISGVQDIGGVNCFIKETVTNQDQNPREYYEVNPEKGLLLHRQDFFMFNPKLGNLELKEAKVDPPQVVMEFPLTPGKSWTRSADMGGMTQSAIFLVRGEEEVETPAGKFTALKIESHGGNSAPAGNTAGTEFSALQWYVRDIGMVKEIVKLKDLTSTTVLKEFKAGS